MQEGQTGSHVAKIHTEGLLLTQEGADYFLIPNKTSIFSTTPGEFPSLLLRFDVETARHEFFQFL
jgi:hypothetical protein